MRSLRGFGYAIARTFIAMFRAPGATTWSVGAIALAFALFGLVHLAISNLDRVATRLGGGQMVVYLDNDVSSEHADKIATALAQLPAVEKHRYVSQEQAFARLRATLDDDALLNGLEQSMVPASIEVALAGGVHDVAAVHPVMTRLEAIPGVDSVEVSGAWLDRLTSLRTDLRRASWGLLALTAAAVIFFIAMATAWRVATRRREARILGLLGATRRFVRGPILIEGLLQGAAGAGLAVLGLWLLFHFGSNAASDAFAQLFDRAHAPVFLPPTHLLALIAGGAFVGMLGALLAVRRYDCA